MRVISLSLMLTVVNFALGASGPGASAVAPAAETEFSIAAPDTVWYITNRAQRDDDWINQRAELSYGFRTFHVAPIRRDAVSFEMRLEVKPRTAASLDTAAFFAGLARSLREAGPDGALLLHVHGYATSINEATEEAAEMRRRGGFDGPVVVFAWPANDLGVTWPSSGKLFTSAYWQDSSAASASAPDLARTIERLVRAVGAERVVVSAHSMGNQLLSEALSDETLASQLRRDKLRGLAFVAPDVDREYFRDSVVPRAAAQASGVTLYGARNDLLLKLSGTIHGGRPRAGLLDASLRWPAALHVVDITDGRSAAFWLGPWADTHHALRREGSALVDLFSIVVAKAPVTCREALGAISVPTTDAPDGGTVQWRLTDAPLPAREGIQGGTESLSCPRELSAR